MIFENKGDINNRNGHKFYKEKTLKTMQKARKNHF